MHDKGLIDRIREGDRAAFAAIIERHQHAIFAFLRARLVQASDAEDMTQDVFLRFYTARARFDAAHMVRPWLLGIARNLLREHIRGVTRRKEVAWTQLCLDVEAAAGARDDDPDEAQTFLPTCLDSLGPSARQAIELRYHGELKLAEIGERLRRSEGAIKLLMHRARQALRECLTSKLRNLDR